MTEEHLLADAIELARTGRGRLTREQSGVSLEEMAAAVGVSVVELMAWELGERKPGGDAARDYVRVLRGMSRRP